MIHPDIRHAPAKRHAFGHRQTDEERADKSGATGHRDTARSLTLTPAFAERAIDDRQDIAEVLARGKLGHDAAIGDRVFDPVTRPD